MSSNNVIAKIARQLNPKPEKKISIAVLASGNGSNLQALIDFSKRNDSHFSVAAVVSNNPDSYALKRAELAFIKHRYINHRHFSQRGDFEQALVDFLDDGLVDLIVLAGFMRVLGPVFLRRFEHRIINLHPSLLPKYKGLNAIGQAMIAKDERTGCTVHLVDEGLDTGPIIAQSSCPIFSNDDLLALKTRIQALEHELLPKTIDRIAHAAITKNFA